MTENFKIFVEKFKITDLLIVETDFWKWSVRPLQCTVGAGILSLKRPAEQMLELTSEEGADFSKIVRIIERTLYSAFKMDKMNYLMLMMVDIHIHFHVIPRYSQTKQFEGIIYEDKSWPKPPVLDATVSEMNDLISIRDYLKSQLHLS